VQSLAKQAATDLKSPIETFSTEALVSCAMNPRECGATGGCGSGSVELAFDLVKSRGVPLAAEWPYISGRRGKQDICDVNKFQAPFLVSVAGYQVLPRNDFYSLLDALFRLGHPIAVAVDATNWHYYAGGIYSDTDAGPGDFHINHAATLVAFQKPSTTKGYYMIKNSWGPWFGESGFMKVEMKKNEAEHCGWDTEPHKGAACEGDPEKTWVCGTCGILYDSVYPEGVRAIKSNIAPGEGYHAPEMPDMNRRGQRTHTETGLSRGANWKP